MFRQTNKDRIFLDITNTVGTQKTQDPKPWLGSTTLYILLNTERYSAFSTNAGKYGPE